MEIVGQEELHSSIAVIQEERFSSRRDEGNTGSTAKNNLSEFCTLKLSSKCFNILKTEKPHLQIHKDLEYRSLPRRFAIKRQIESCISQPRGKSHQVKCVNQMKIIVNVTYSTTALLLFYCSCT